MGDFVFNPNNFENQRINGGIKFSSIINNNSVNNVPTYLSNEYGDIPTPGYDPASETLKLSQANYMDTMNKFYNTKLADMNSWQHQYLQPATQIIGALGTLSGMYLGFKQLGMAREQLGIAKEQWSRAKQEADRIAKVREGIVKAYTS